MQLMPETAARLGVQDPTDYTQNIDGGVRELARLYKQYNGDQSLVAAGFVAVFYLSLGLTRLSESLPSWLKTGGEIFPAVFIASLFIVWNEYMISFLRATDIGSAGVSAVITTLCFNGFLPCRIALLSAPPVRPVNVAVGIIALITYIAGLA
jgi:hypothetical protein